MNTHIERGAFTDAVLASLVKTGKPVGDAEMPRGGIAGWQGAVNADWSNFVPYVVVTPLQATYPSFDSGTFADTSGDVILPYGLTSYGASRTQCEWMADSARAAIRMLSKTTVLMDSIGAEAYERSIISVQVQSIGQINRVPETDPPYYGQTDVVAFWTSR